MHFTIFILSQHCKPAWLLCYDVLYDDVLSSDVGPQGAELLKHTLRVCCSLFFCKYVVLLGERMILGEIQFGRSPLQAIPGRCNTMIRNDKTLFYSLPFGPVDQANFSN